MSETLKISELDALADPLEATAVVPATQDGATVKVTAQQISNFVLAQVTTPDEDPDADPGTELEVSVTAGDVTLSGGDLDGIVSIVVENESGADRIITLPAVAKTLTAYGYASNPANSPWKLKRGTKQISFAAAGGGIVAWDGSTNDLRLLVRFYKSLSQLADGPGSYAGSGDHFVTINSSGDAFQYTDAATARDLMGLAQQQFVWGTGALQTEASQSLGVEFKVARAFTVPANMLGSQVNIIDSPADGTWVGDLLKNGSSVGTISVTTGDVVTLATTSGAAQAFAVGDRCNITGPATADSAAIIAFTLLVTLD